MGLVGGASGWPAATDEATASSNDLPPPPTENAKAKGKGKDGRRSSRVQEATAGVSPPPDSMDSE